MLEDAPRYLELAVHGSECDDFGWEGCTVEAGGHCAAESDCATSKATIDLDHLGNLPVLGDYGGMPAGHDAYVGFETDDAYYLEFRIWAFIDISWE